MDKFRNKYRISSVRSQNWDYGWNASYFVTICTANRECYFGDIVNSEMKLSEIGEIIEPEWLKTFEIRPDMNLQMGVYVVMPNHFHAIITIGKNEYNTERLYKRGIETGAERGIGRGVERRDAMHCISNANNENTANNEKTKNTANTGKTTKPFHPNKQNPKHKNQFGPQSKNLASIIRGFKSAVTTNARKIHFDFDWQPRFYEHIIRDDKSYQRIKNYIINNPKNWNNDKFKND